MNLDQVTYGNPSNEQLPYLEKKTFVRFYFYSAIVSTLKKMEVSSGTKRIF